jgi:hypothetical protein
MREIVCCLEIVIDVVVGLPLAKQPQSLQKSPTDPQTTQ